MREHAVRVRRAGWDRHGVSRYEDVGFARKPDLESTVGDVQETEFVGVLDERRLDTCAAVDVGGAELSTGILRAGDDCEELTA